MEERNAQIEKEDEEKKAEELKERKRKVLGLLSKIISLWPISYALPIT